MNSEVNDVGGERAMRNLKIIIIKTNLGQKVKICIYMRDSRVANPLRVVIKSYPSLLLALLLKSWSDTAVAAKAGVAGGCTSGFLLRCYTNYYSQRKYEKIIVEFED